MYLHPGKHYSNDDIIIEIETNILIKTDDIINFCKFEFRITYDMKFRALKAHEILSA